MPLFVFKRVGGCSRSWLRRAGRRSLLGQQQVGALSTWTFGVGKGLTQQSAQQPQHQNHRLQKCIRVCLHAKAFVAGLHLCKLSCIPHLHPFMPLPAGATLYKAAVRMVANGLLLPLTCNCKGHDGYEKTLASQAMNLLVSACNLCIGYACKLG